MTDIMLVNGIFSVLLTLETMGLSYLKSVLQGCGYSVEILDPCFFSWSPDEVVAELNKRSFRTLGISLMGAFKEDLEDLGTFLKGIRNAGYDGHICAGGHAATLLPDMYLHEFPEIDSIVMGDGEIIYPELVDCCLNGKPWKHIRGVAHRNNSEIVHKTGGRYYSNLDDIPFMDRDYLEDMIKIFGTDVLVRMVGSRGCYGTCTFCTEARIWKSLEQKKTIRFRSVKNIVDELELLVRKYGVWRFDFVDRIFLPRGRKGTERAEEFAESLAERSLDINFQVLGRVETFSKRAIAALRKCGCTQFFVGVESINREDLRFYGKDMSPETIHRCIRYFREEQVGTEVDSPTRLKMGYIAYHPFTTLNSLKASLEFCRRYHLSPKRLIYRLRLYPGIELYDTVKAAGLLRGENNFQFVDRVVGLIFLVMNTLATHYYDPRERIRRLERVVQVYGIDISLRRLSELRQRIDAVFLEIAEQMILLGEEHGDDADTEKEFRKALFHAEVRLSGLYREWDVYGQIERVEQEFGMTMEMCDLFDKVTLFPKDQVDHLRKKYGTKPSTSGNRRI